MTHFVSPVHVTKTLITIGPFCFLFAVLNLCTFVPNLLFKSRGGISGLGS